jgi:hypothetical protein
MPEKTTKIVVHTTHGKPFKRCGLAFTPTPTVLEVGKDITVEELAWLRRAAGEDGVLYIGDPDAPPVRARPQRVATSSADGGKVAPTPAPPADDPATAKDPGKK